MFMGPRATAKRILWPSLSISGCRCLNRFTQTGGARPCADSAFRDTPRLQQSAGLSSRKGIGLLPRWRRRRTRMVPCTCRTRTRSPAKHRLWKCPDRFEVGVEEIALIGKIVQRCASCPVRKPGAVDINPVGNAGSVSPRITAEVAPLLIVHVLFPPPSTQTALRHGAGRSKYIYIYQERSVSESLLVNRNRILVFVSI